jgi:Terminase RNaseH-like domain
MSLGPIKLERDNGSRANAVAPLCEAGQVNLPRGAPWLADFLDEHSSFPNATHDDTVDTTTQALTFRRGSGPPGISLLYITRNVATSTHISTASYLQPNFKRFLRLKAGYVMNCRLCSAKTPFEQFSTQCNISVAWLARPQFHLLECR